MSDNGYVKRGELRLQPRTVKRPVAIQHKDIPKRPTIKQDVVPKKGDINSESTALPTIPIMIYATGNTNKDSGNFNIKPINRKYLDNTVTRKASDIKPYTDVMKKDSLIQVAPVKEYNKDEMIVNALDIEPPTHPVDKNFKKNIGKISNKGKKHIKNRIIRHRKPLLRQLPLALAVFVILGVTGYVSYSTWQTNNQIKQALQGGPSVLGANKKPISNNIKSPTGSEAATADNTVNPLDEYIVSADLPRAIYIDNIDVSARLLPMGLNDDMTLQSPSTLADAGWYTDSAKPGQSGAMLIDGHTNTTIVPPGVFSYLRNLNTDDIITIERGDGARFNYSIVYIEEVALSELDMNKTLIPYNGADQGVNLITCTGAFTTDSSTLDHRLIVYAVLK